MHNIWYPRRKRFGSFEIVITIIVFIALLVWFSIGFNAIRISTSSEQLNEATATVNKAVVLCYSIEGSFPPNLQYLKDNYNLVIDENTYIVHYSAFASNIMPDIVLFIRD